MALKTRVGVVGMLLLACAVSGCTVQATMPSYRNSSFHAIIAAETARSGGVALTEKEVQQEVDRLMALKPRKAVPSKVVLYEVPSSGKSQIRSPQKWLELRQATSQAMKKALEDTKLFEDVEFLPEIFVPAGGSTDLKTLRIAAARVHADGLLLYTTETGYEERANPFAAFYITIVGLFVVPGSQETSMAVSKAVVVDVPTGYINVHPEVYTKESSGWVPATGLDPGDLEFQARKRGIESLASAVATKFKGLKPEP